MVDGHYSYWFELPMLSRIYRNKGGSPLKVLKGTSNSAEFLSLLWISGQTRRCLLLVSKLQRWGDNYKRRNDFSLKDFGIVGQTMERVGIGQLRNVRFVVLVLAVLNMLMLSTGVIVAVSGSRAKCPHSVTLASVVMVLVAVLRLVWMVGMGFAQAVTASTMIVEDSKASQSSGVENGYRRTRRRWYARWLWWSRLGLSMTIIQVVSTCYLLWTLARSVSTQGKHISFCIDDGRTEKRWLAGLLLALPTLGTIIMFAQCCVGSDVLSWRLLYGGHHGAWRAHYRQMFDHGIREVLCCLGRRRYMSVLEEDEVDSVAALLGDLVAYRAVGASHLEVLAGIALLKESASDVPPDDSLDSAPEALVREATVLHPYAVAAYTGPLLDVGRNPLTFPCAWLYRQGVLTPWRRHRMPQLEGDNWWRGHAAAFLRFSQLPPEALRKGRVLQERRESVYFVIVLHHLRYVVVAVRGTETPEDLLTDGLGRESALTDSDLCGVLKNNTISERVKQQLLATMPHFGHIGVIEAARELALELDNLPDADGQDSNGNSFKSQTTRISSTTGSRTSLLGETKGLLSSLLGPGGECEGYALRLVGHSLGGAIAALAGLRLANRYPNLHVYTFGVLPCVDFATAEACSSFITSIIYNDEFSSRLSVAAVMRLRAAALQALATDASTDSVLVTKITRRFFSSGNSNENSNRRRRRLVSSLKGCAFLCGHACRCILQMSKHSSSSPLVGSQLTQFLQVNYRGGPNPNVPSDSLREFLVEVYIPPRNYPVTVTDILASIASEHGLGNTDELSLVESSDAAGVCSVLADGEPVVLGAGSDVGDEEETEELVGSSEIVHEEGELVVEEAGPAENTVELLENGMPKHLVGLGPGEDLQELWPAEMFVPGLVIHLVRDPGDSSWSAFRRSFAFSRNPQFRKRPKHKAYLKDRKQFRDIHVSPAMFLDHMPWKCQYALNDIVEQLKPHKQEPAASSTNLDIV